MARTAALLFVAVFVCIASGSSFAADRWEPASLDDPSAGVVGADISDLPPDYSKGADQAKRQKGILIGHVVEGGFVHHAGAKKFDIIVALNGWRVDTIPELCAASRTLVPGKLGNAVILRSTVTSDGVAYDPEPIEITAVVPTRRDGIHARLVTVEDRVSGEQWIRHVRSAKDRSTETQLSPCFQIKNGKATNLSVVFSVVQNSLASPRAIGIRTGEKYTPFPVKITDVGTDIGLETSAAWVEWPLKGDLFTCLSDVARQRRGQLRFEIRDGSNIDVDLSHEAAMRISDVLVGFKLKGGNIADDQLSWYREQVEAGDLQLAKLTAGIKLKKFLETSRSANRTGPPALK